MRGKSGNHLANHLSDKRSFDTTGLQMLTRLQNTREPEMTMT